MKPTKADLEWAFSKVVDELEDAKRKIKDLENNLWARKAEVAMWQTKVTTLENLLDQKHAQLVRALARD